MAQIHDAEHLFDAGRISLNEQQFNYFKEAELDFSG